MLVRYNDLLFQPDMLSAEHEDGQTIRFTRQERALLLRLVKKPHTLVTRAQVLESLGGNDGTLTDRHVDYLINRLRKRLGDNARTSRFIVTQYGEGYYWAADPVSNEPLSGFMLIGPVFGLEDLQTLASNFPGQLRDGLDKIVGKGRNILSFPHYRASAGGEDSFNYTLEISAYAEQDTLHLALVLREGRTTQVITRFRRCWKPQQDSGEHTVLASTITEALWRHEAFSDSTETNPTDRLAHVRLHDAAMMLIDDTVSWRENAKRLQSAFETDGSNPQSAVMLALNHYTRLLQSLGETPPLSSANWAMLEDEIESLVFRVLPDAHNDPHLLLAIAKLLRFIDRGFLDLAAKLTDEAFTQSSAFAASFSMKAQIAASRGEIEEAGALYDKAIELAEPGSQFHIYLVILKAVAMVAGNKRSAVEQLAVQLYDLVPEGQDKWGLFLVSAKAKNLAPTQEQALAAMPPAFGQHLTGYLYRISARQFTRPAHQRNILKGIVTHLLRIHGPDAIAPEVREIFPRMMRRAGDARSSSQYSW